MSTQHHKAFWFFRSVFVLSATLVLSLGYVQAQITGFIPVFVDEDGSEGASNIFQDTDGNIGIGTTTPTAKLHVNTSGTGGVGHFMIDNPNSTAVALTVRSNDRTTAVVGFQTGTGAAADFSIDNPANSSSALFASHNGSGAAVHGRHPGGLAGLFEGNVIVSGNLSKGGGSFKIDHPLDPANKYLYHSFVESPDMMNVYNGNVVLNANGEAVVVLPEWFEVLNRDFRYQLTCIGGFAPIYIAEKIMNNRFKIGGGQPRMEVSWQITGIRQDAYANAHPIPVEESKPVKERGYYLHPAVFGQPEEKGVEWVRNPELMRQIKDSREKLQSSQKE